MDDKQALSWDLLMDISGGAARAVAHAVHVKLGCCALPHPQSAATAVPRLFEPFAVLAETVAGPAAAYPAPSAGGPSNEALHCCYTWHPRGALLDSQQLAPLLAAAWTNERGSLLAMRVLGVGSGAPLPTHPHGGAHRSSKPDVKVSCLFQLAPAETSFLRTGLAGRSTRTSDAMSLGVRSMGASASCSDSMCAAVMAATGEVRPAAAYSQL